MLGATARCSRCCSREHRAHCMSPQRWVLGGSPGIGVQGNQGWCPAARGVKLPCLEPTLRRMGSTWLCRCPCTPVPAVPRRCDSSWGCAGAPAGAPCTLGHGSAGPGGWQVWLHPMVSRGTDCRGESGIEQPAVRAAGFTPRTLESTTAPRVGPFRVEHLLSPSPLARDMFAGTR